MSWPLSPSLASRVSPLTIVSGLFFQFFKHTKIYLFFFNFKPLNSLDHLCKFLDHSCPDSSRGWLLPHLHKSPYTASEWETFPTLHREAGQWWMPWTPSTLWGLREHVFIKYLRGYLILETIKALRKLGGKTKQEPRMTTYCSEINAITEKHGQVLRRGDRKKTKPRWEMPSVRSTSRDAADLELCSVKS